MQLDNIQTLVSIDAAAVATAQEAVSNAYRGVEPNPNSVDSEDARQVPSLGNDHYLGSNGERLPCSANSDKQRASTSLIKAGPKGRIAQSEHDRIREALFTIPADVTRDDWVKVGMALKSHCGDMGFSLFDEWSQEGESYNERDAKDTYKSFKDDKGIKIGTLFHIAKQHGYGVYKNELMRRAPHQSLTNSSRTMEAADRLQVDCNSQYSVASERSEELLRRLPDATADTPYLKKKGLAPVSGMKQTRDGKLVVPVYDADGNLCTLQFIESDGRKRFKSGGKAKGGFLLLEEPSSDVLLCEGVATGLTLRLTGLGSVAIAFSKGNLRAVAEILRARYPNVRLTICADNDRHGPQNGGLEAAKQVAIEMKALLAVPNFDSTQGSDFDDLRQHKGIDEVARQLANPSIPDILLYQICQEEAAAPAMAGRFQVLTADDLRATKPLGWRIAGVFPLTGIGAIYGPSGSGKSFLALDMAASIADGVEAWFGRRITQAPVTYLALEGEHGMSKRIEAWAQHNGKRPSQQLRFITQRLSLRDPADVDELGATIVRHGGINGVTIIDTLNRAAGGADENSSSHMGELIAGADRLKDITHGLVIIVHHTGKNQQAGLRGHSSLHAALDGAIEVCRDSQGRRWEISKSKDDADGQSCTFVLQSVELGRDDFGETVTSCVVIGVSPASVKRRKSLGGNQHIAAKVLNAYLNDGELNHGNVPRGTPSIDLEEAVCLVAEHLPCAPNKKKYNARNVLDRMISSGIYGSCGKRLWSTDMLPEK